MVAYSQISAAPKYRRRASTGSVPFHAATLKMASLGTTSIGANVGLQKTLAQRIPSIAWSNIAAPPSLQRANVPSSIDFGKPIQPAQIASEKALTDVGESIGRKFFANPTDSPQPTSAGRGVNILPQPSANILPGSVSTNLQSTARTAGKFI